MRKVFLAMLCFISLNSQAQTWTQQASLPNTFDTRNHAVTFAIDNYGYVVTGGSDTAYYNDFYRYDPLANTWAQMADFPDSARSFSIGVENGGKAYVGFGFTPNGTYLKDFWSYDPVTDQWTQLASLPGAARTHPALVATEDKIFVGCGGAATGNLKDWWEYDIPTNTWSQKPDFPGVRRHHPYHFSLNDEAYVAFGHGAGIFKDMYKYNPDTEIWTVRASLPAQGRVAGTQFSYNGKGYALSGQGEDHRNLPTGEFWEYDPVANSWTALTAHPSNGRWAPGSFVIGNNLYLTCGEINDAPPTNVRDLWRYSFAVPVDVTDIEKTNIKVYPNPANNVLQVQDPESEISELRIVDFSGRVLINTMSKQVNVSSLANGLYQLQMTVADKVVSTSFIKR